MRSGTVHLHLSIVSPRVSGGLLGTGITWLNVTGRGPILRSIVQNMMVKKPEPSTTMLPCLMHPGELMLKAAVSGDAASFKLLVYGEYRFEENN